MGVTALTMDIVCEDSGHQVVPMAPNFCITPGAAAGAPAPLPYPITASSSKLAPGTNKVKQKGKKTLNAKSKVKSCNGNQPGSQKDVSTFQTGKKSWPFPVPAVTVHFEGMPIAITGNPGMGNSM
ncbi:MAG TPA: DUF4150 domain-containing protein [Sandaracinaceae bacterium LLY-WYZ-13_1]|nr:DUF4150 domain-containing protein [Sandaracinaceae bacterium LLY-WYZ-13_1]